MNIAGSSLGTLVVLRGNSGSGKTTVARALRDVAVRPLAWIEQDYLRRTVLAELGDQPDPVTPGLIDVVVRHALDRGHDVVLEGILDSQRYGGMLRQFHREHPDNTAFFYFSVPFAETVRRHSTRPIAGEFGAAEMRSWYRQCDPLGFVDEYVVDAASSVEQTVGLIVGRTSLADPRDRRPSRE